MTRNDNTQGSHSCGALGRRSHCDSGKTPATECCTVISPQTVTYLEGGPTSRPSEVQGEGNPPHSAGQAAGSITVTAGRLGWEEPGVPLANTASHGIGATRQRFVEDSLSKSTYGGPTFTLRG